MSDKHELDDLLLHWGIKGMKWGFNDGEPNGKRTAEEEEIDDLAKKYNLSEKDAKKLAKLIKDKNLSPKQVDEAVKFTKSIRKSKGFSLDKIALAIMDVDGYNSRMKNQDRKKNDDRIKKGLDKKLKDVKGKKKSIIDKIKSKLDTVLPKKETKPTKSTKKTTTSKYINGDKVDAYISDMKKKGWKENKRKKIDMSTVKSKTFTTSINGKPVKEQQRNFDKYIKNTTNKMKRDAVKNNSTYRENGKILIEPKKKKKD